MIGLYIFMCNIIKKSIYPEKECSLKRKEYFYIIIIQGTNVKTYLNADFYAVNSYNNKFNIFLM